MFFENSFVVQRIMNFSVILALLTAQIGILGQKTGASIEKEAPVSFLRNTRQESNILPDSTVLEKAEQVEIIALEKEDSLLFIENQGQFDPKILFRAMGNNLVIDVTQNEIWISLVKVKPKNPDKGSELPRISSTPMPGQQRTKNNEKVDERVNLRIEHAESLNLSKVSGCRPVNMPTTNYILGNDPQKWVSSNTAYQCVLFEDAAPGMDLEVSAKNGFLLQRSIFKETLDSFGMEGTDPLYDASTANDFLVNGAQETRAVESGLLAKTQLGYFLFSSTETYLDEAVIEDRSSSPSAPKVNPAILPVGHNRLNLLEDELLFSTYFGGSSFDRIESMSVNIFGEITVTGYSGSIDLPESTGYSLYDFSGEIDIFVAQLNSTASDLNFVTYIGGEYLDFANTLKQDSNGSIYVSGFTISEDFPTTANAFDTTFNSGQSPFLAILSPEGDELVYSTFISTGQGFDLALDQNEDVVLIGQTDHDNQIGTVGSFSPSHNGGYDGFITKFDTTNREMLFYTYLGGTSEDCELTFDYRECSIAITEDGDIVISGMTNSQNFPVTVNAFQPEKNGGSDLFVSILSGDGSQLLYSTYIGGNNDEIIENGGTAIDQDGYAVFIGKTKSDDFPTTENAYATFHYEDGGNNDSVLSILDFSAEETEDQMIYSSYFGGEGDDNVKALLITGDQSLVIVGNTNMYHFPILDNAFETTINYIDSFLIRLDPTSDYKVDQATYFGASGFETISVARNSPLDPEAIIVAGLTNSFDFPLSDDAFDTNHDWSEEGFVSSLIWPEPLEGIDLFKSSLEVDPTSITIQENETAIATVTIRDSQGNPLPGKEIQIEAEGDSVDLSQTNFVTDSLGQVSAEISSPVVQTIRISASIVDTDTYIQDEVNLLVSFWGLSAATSSVTANPALALADGEDSSSITVTIRDNFNQPMPGIEVEITASGSAQVEQTELITDQDGKVFATVSDEQTETVVITPLVNDIPLGKTATIRFEPTDIAAVINGPQKSSPSNQEQFTVGVRNIGRLNAKDVVLGLTLPEEFILDSQGGPVNPIQDGNYYEWDLGTLTASQRIEFGVTVSVDPETEADQTLQTQVEVSTASIETNLSNNTRTFNTHIVPSYSFPAQLSPAEQSIGIGDTAEFSLLVRNTGFYPAIFNVSQSGLDNDWVSIDPDQTHLQPGQSQTVVISVSTDDCEAEGEYPFTVYLEIEDHPELSAEYQAQLNLNASPLIQLVNPLQGMITGSGTVNFSWRTSPATTGVVTYYPLSDPEDEHILTAGTSAVSQAVQASNLTHNEDYGWSLSVTSSCGNSVLDDQSFRVGTGIAFLNHTPNVEIDRDYNQIVEIAVRNDDDEAHTLTATVQNPYPDLIINFVGSGSVDETITLGPGVSTTLRLAAHAQDTILSNYQLTAVITADLGSSDPLIDTANINLQVLTAFDVDIQRISTDTVTGVATYRIENVGDKMISDLRLDTRDVATGELASVYIYPDISHANLGAGQSIQFEVIPLFNEDHVGQSGAATQIEFELEVSGSNESETFNEQVGCSSGAVQAVEIQNSCMVTTKNDWYCTNRPIINVNFKIPGFVNSENLLSMDLNLLMNPASSDVREHSSAFSFNGVPVASFSDLIPNGQLSTGVPTNAFQDSIMGPSVQQMRLQSTHSNGGHYIVASSFELGLGLSSANTYVCAGSSTQADTLVQQVYHLEDLSSSTTCTVSQVYRSSTYSSSSDFCSTASNTQVTVANPINTLTGALEYSAGDISIPTLAGELEFRRWYSSLTTELYTTYLGYGWTHSLDLRLIFPNDPQGEEGIVLLKGPSANQYKFTINQDGTFTAYPGLCGDLIQTGNEYYFTDKNGTAYTFNIAGLITRKENSEGHAWVYSYNTQQQLVRVTDEISGRFLALAYDPQGRISTVSDQSERSVSYDYDETTGDLISFSDLGNQEWTYDYYEAATTGHLLSQVTDPSERIIERTEYDEQGRAVRQFDGTDAQIAELTYQNGFGLTTVVDANGNSSVLNFGNDNALKSQEDALGATSEKDFDPNFNLSSLTDADGNVTELEWSEDGRNLLQVGDALGNFTDFEYEDDNLSKIIDAMGNETNLTYEGKLLTSSTDEYGNITTYTYTTAMDSPQPAGLLKSITDALGRTTSYVYDENGQLTETTNELGISSAYVYNDLGQIITQFTPDGRANWTCYDGFGRVVRTVENASGDGWSPESDPCDKDNYEASGDPDYDLISERIYDASGNLIASIDRSGMITRTYYDSANRPIAIVQNLKNWDIFDPNPPSPEYRTASENLISQTVYDNAGNVIATITTDGKIMRTYYDALQRPEFFVRNLSGQDIFTPTPPVASNRGVDYNVTTQNIYDKRGNLIATVPLTEGCAIQKSSGSNPVITATAACRVTRSYYDALNRVIAVVQNLSGQSISNATAPLRNPANKDINLRSDSIYDAVGNLIATIDPAGSITRTYYDALQRVEYTVENLSNWPVETDDPPPVVLRNEEENVITQMAFDAAGNLIATVDPSGVIHRTWYDEINRPFLSVANLFDPGQPEATLEDLLALTEAPAYDPDYPDLNVPSSEPLYDEFGNNIGSMDPQGTISRTYFDVLQRPLQSVQNLSGQDVEVNEVPEYNEEFPDENIPGSRNVYDSSGRQIGLIDPTGIITRNYYDQLGRIWLVVRNLSGQDIADETPPSFNTETPEFNIRTETIYNLAGQAIASIDTYGRITRTYFDDLNRAVAMVQNLSGQDVYTESLPSFDPDYPDQNILTRTVYDTFGNTIATITADGTTQRSYYDNVGRVLITVNNLQGQDIGVETPPSFDPEDPELIDQNVPTYFFYDVSGNLTDKHDANGIVTHYEYDARDRLTAVTENYRPPMLADNETNVRTEYTYDVNGNRLSIRDANAVLNESYDEMYFDYDALGRQYAEGDPLGNTWSQVYDILGRRIASTDANGATVYYEYDGGGRLLMIDYPEPQADVYFTYDIAGRRVGMADGQGDTTWDYDALGRVTGITDANENLVGYEYDALGNRSALIYPDEKRVDYSYDALYRLQMVSDWEERETIYEYDSNGRLLLANLPNGVLTSYQYDGSGQLLNLTHQKDDITTGAYGYSYDAVGNRIAAEEYLLIPEAEESSSFTAREEDRSEVPPLPEDEDQSPENDDEIETPDKDEDSCTVPDCNDTEEIEIYPVSVTVANTYGLTQEGMTVRVFQRETDSGISSITDEYGQVHFSLPYGEYHFLAEREEGGAQFWSGEAGHCVLPGCMEAIITINPQTEVSVLDEAGNPLNGVEVAVYSGEDDIGYRAVSGENGHAVFLLPEGEYHFRAEINGEVYRSGEEDHCRVPDCELASIREGSSLQSRELLLGTQVTVLVTDTEEEPRAGLWVRAFNGTTYTGQSAQTDSNGEAVLYLEDGSYRFRADISGGVFWSGESNHCTVPACTSAEITVADPVVVTVKDFEGFPRQGITVRAYTGGTYTGVSVTTLSNGKATFSLYEGDYRFRVAVLGAVFWSGETDHCTVPGCDSVTVFLPVPVTVTVTDTAGVPQEGLFVGAYDGSTYTQMAGFTNTNGEAALILMNGSYRFNAIYGWDGFWSGPVNHCTVPGCTSAAITVPGPIPVTVVDSDETPREGLPVYAYDGETYTDISDTTDEDGRALLDLPDGSYRFMTELNGVEFWSGESNHCTVFGCLGAVITVSKPLTVHVEDTEEEPKQGLTVSIYDGEDDTGYSEVTDENGDAVFTLPFGSYRAMTEYGEAEYWSGEENHCTIPGCEEMDIIVPGGGQSGVIERTIFYEYDPLYRLTEANYDDGLYFHYEYDAVGNRLSEEMIPSIGSRIITNTYEYDVANRLIAVNSVEYEWDDNGNLIDDGTSTYVYDFNNKLMEITKGTDAFSYAYNGLGDRVSQTVNEVTTDYVLDMNAGLTQVLQDGTNTYLYGVNRVAELSDTEEEYYLADALGSVRQLTDAEAALLLTRSYEPYGGVLEAYGQGQTAYAFTGEMYDPQTGLVYLRARYYAPYLNQFIQPDSILHDPRVPVDWNRYSYGRNNPLLFIDPSGMISCENSNDAECVIQATRLRQAAADIQGMVSTGTLLPVEGLATLVSKSMEFFDNDFRGMMWGMTVVIDGYDPNQNAVWKQGWNPDKYAGGLSPFFIGQDWLPYLNDPDKNDVDWGGTGREWVHSLRGDWREEYWDKTANQAYHFWFSASVRFFDRGVWSLLGNIVHDNPLKWEDYDYINSPEEDDDDDNDDNDAPPISGISKPDYLLALAGMRFGRELTQEYELLNLMHPPDCRGNVVPVTTFDPAFWIRSNLK